MLRLLTDQPQSQGQPFVPLACDLHFRHQPANLLDALLVGVDWLGDAWCFGSDHDASVQDSTPLNATQKDCAR